jgi:hypothetical protein
MQDVADPTGRSNATDFDQHTQLVLRGEFRRRVRSAQDAATADAPLSVRGMGISEINLPRPQV